MSQRKHIPTPYEVLVRCLAEASSATRRPVHTLDDCDANDEATSKFWVCAVKELDECTQDLSPEEIPDDWSNARRFMVEMAQHFAKGLGDQSHLPPVETSELPTFGDTFPSGRNND